MTIEKVVTGFDENILNVNGTLPVAIARFVAVPVVAPVGLLRMKDGR